MTIGSQGQHATTDPSQLASVEVKHGHVAISASVHATLLKIIFHNFMNDFSQSIHKQQIMSDLLNILLYLIM